MHSSKEWHSCNIQDAFSAQLCGLTIVSPKPQNVPDVSKMLLWHKGSNTVRKVVLMLWLMHMVRTQMFMCLLSNKE